MSLYDLFDLCLALLVVGVAGWTIFARELYGAVVDYVAYGLLLAIVWIRLLAPDVALTEAAIGGGATGRDDQKALAGILCLGVAAVLAAAVLTLPDEAPTLAPRAAAGLPAAGSATR